MKEEDFQKAESIVTRLKKLREIRVKLKAAKKFHIIEKLHDNSEYLEIILANQAFPLIQQGADEYLELEIKDLEEELKKI